MTKLTIKRALVSVSNKTNLHLLVDFFKKNNVHILSTGGTFEYLHKLEPDLNLEQISKYTGFNEILDGRVKTLNPLIHGGILAKKNNKTHLQQLKKNKILPIDLVVVNLYPFETISKKKTSTEKECIENIDIGGPTMIRAAAKNFENIAILSQPDNYKEFLKKLKNKNELDIKYRKYLASIAFETTSYYEGIISNWFNKDSSHFCENQTAIPIKKISNLRYGENPHQRATVYELGQNSMTKISGKDISFNNICDLEIAMELSEQFDLPACVILKHGNPCGVALHKNQEKAYSKALKCDPISAFGGVIALNKPVTKNTSRLIVNTFTEVIIAPDFSSEALEIFSSKKNLILVKYRSSKKNIPKYIKSTRNFLLIQDRDEKIIKKNDLQFVTKIKPKKSDIDDMLFAFVVCKFVNSNAIVLAKNLATVGIGVGQTNRLESAKLSIKSMKNNFEKINPVMASDGFFPFTDVVKLCSNSKISAIIQPGGSIQDKKVVEEAEKQKIPMVLTKIRHFKH